MHRALKKILLTSGFIFSIFLTGCATYQEPSSDTPSATIVFKGIDDTTDRSFIYTDAVNCQGANPVPIIWNFSADTKTKPVRIPAGELVTFRRLYSKIKFYAIGTAVNSTESDCDFVASFVPIAGKNYEVITDDVNNICHIIISEVQYPDPGFTSTKISNPVPFKLRKIKEKFNLMYGSTAICEDTDQFSNKN